MNPTIEGLCFTPVQLLYCFPYYNSYFLSTTINRVTIVLNTAPVRVQIVPERSGRDFHVKMVGRYCEPNLVTRDYRHVITH